MTFACSAWTACWRSSRARRPSPNRSISTVSRTCCSRWPASSGAGRSRSCSSCRWPMPNAAWRRTWAPSRRPRAACCCARTPMPWTGWPASWCSSTARSGSSIRPSCATRCATWRGGSAATFVAGRVHRAREFRVADQPLDYPRQHACSFTACRLSSRRCSCSVLAWRPGPAACWRRRPARRPRVRGRQAAQPTFSGAAAKQQVDALAGQIGSRPAGSAAYDRAVSYAADQLRQWGYQPTLQSFPLQTYDDRGSQVEVVDSGTQLAADTLTYSIAGDVQAPLVAAGLGQPTDLAGVEVRGKIALIQRGTLRFSDKVANAAAAGAVGVIVYNDSPGRVQGSLLRPEGAPAATISAESGQQLVDLLSHGPVTARLVVDASTEERSGTNVVAELPGGRPDAGTVVFGAHLDSVPAGPGANDDGSVSAVVLGLAHELAQRPAAERALT